MAHHYVSDDLPRYPYPPVAEADTPQKRPVRLFRNGANQALRIPKEFELPGKEALIHREGDRLVIEPVPDIPRKGNVAALLLALDEIAALGPCDEDFPDVDEGLLPLDDIVL